MSYMVGYGLRYPQRIHHRASSLPSLQAHPHKIACKSGSKYYLTPNPNPNVLIGAVVGGPNMSDAFPDSRPYFQESEPTTYINAPLVGLLAYFSAHLWNEFIWFCEESKMEWCAKVTLGPLDYHYYYYCCCGCCQSKLYHFPINEWKIKSVERKKEKVAFYYYYYFFLILLL